MRTEVSQLVAIGPLPSSKAGIHGIKVWQDALEKIRAPVSDEEAEALVTLFPPEPDECFGLAWALIHIIETAPHWPIRRCLQTSGNHWIELLRLRLTNAGIDVSAHAE